MYEVYLDGKNLYYPGDHINTLTSTDLDRKLNESGTFNITVPPTNPLFSLFHERKSEISIIKDGEEMWSGEVRCVGTTTNNLKKVYVVGELSYLGASSQPQKIYKDLTVLQAFTHVISEHNARVEKRKQFAVGIVTVDNPADITTWTTNYEKTLDYIRSEFCEKLNGYLRIRKENGIRYIDLVRLQDYGKTCQQPIKFGKNLLEYTNDLNSDSIVTVVRPIGAKLESSAVEGLDAYVTIESVNNGQDYIRNEDAVDEFGMVWATVEFDGITEPLNLMEAGEEWLKSQQYADVSIKVTAIDLSVINPNLQAMDIGDSIRVLAKPFGMDKWSYIVEEKLDLLNPTTKHNITIGEKVKKNYTKQVQIVQDELKKKIPQQKVLLEMARNNASEIIKSAMEGNIFCTFDNNGKPRELLIMDTADINTAQKVWRWNINGLGYSSTGYNGEYALAMTMDGQFVADFITAGTMSANRVYGGTLSGVHIDLSSTKEELADIEINSAGNMLCLKMNAYFVESKDNSTGQGFSMSNANIYGTNKYGNKTMVLGNHQGGFINLFSPNGETSTIDMYIGYDGMTTTGSVYCKNLSLSGTKSRVAETKDYSDRLLYCYETPSPLFGDVGEGTIDDTGKCMVFLDEIFSETIETDCQYQVFLQTYGAGECYITERNPMYFMVEGTKGLSFGWEIKATQKGFDTLRLAEFEKDAQEEDTTLSSTYSYLQTLLYNTESEVI